MTRALPSVLWALVVTLAATVSDAEPVRSLQDGRTGLVEFESLTFPLSSGQGSGLFVSDGAAKRVVVSGVLEMPSASPRCCAC
jgi:hypothetical protein